MWPFDKPNLPKLVERYVMPDGKLKPTGGLGMESSEAMWFKRQYELLQYRGWRLVLDQPHKCPRCERVVFNPNRPPIAGGIGGKG